MLALSSSANAKALIRTARSQLPLDCNYIKVVPDPVDALLWHFRLQGFEAPFTGGEYYGTLHFTNKFPYSQPSIILHTPSGRLPINDPIKCFESEEWNEHRDPIRSLLRIVEWMRDGGSHPACQDSDDISITNLSEASALFNRTNRKYMNIFFPELISSRSSGNDTQSIGASAGGGEGEGDPAHEEQAAVEIEKKDTLVDTDGDELMLERQRILKQIKNACGQILSEYLSVPKDTLAIPKFELLEHTNEMHNGKHVVNIAVHLDNLPYLKCNDQTSQEQFREQTRLLIVALLDGLMDVGTALGKRFKFVTVSFENTDASMRAIFNGTCEGIPVHRETEVLSLKLSNTKTSVNGLQNLHRLTFLEELYLDHCPSIMEAGRGVFSILMKKDPLNNLKLLSVVGTSSALSHRWLSEIQASCPNLTQIYFTRKRGVKALGWQDIILMQTMRKPQLLPCGHIGDKQPLLKFGYCSFDRVPFQAAELLPIEPTISYLCKDPTTEKWTVHIVDYSRNPLDAKTYYHSTCGHFFNRSTIAKWFDRVGEANWEEEAKNLFCIACSKPWNNLRICHPHSAESIDEVSFEKLTDVQAYSVADLRRRQRQ